MTEIEEKISALNWRAFFISFIVVLVMSLLKGANLIPDIGINFRSENSSTLDPLSKTKPLLEKKRNVFKISESRSLTGEAYAQDQVQAFSYAVIDYDTGKLLSERNLKEEVPIASLTKIMTAVVALDLASPDEEYYVSKNASDQIPTKIGVVAGEKMTLEELLNAALLTSANDAVEVIMEGIDQKYGKGSFIRAMNHKANFLSLRNTSFDNPQGFDGTSNYSSSHDILILTHYAMENYPLIKEIVRKDYEFLTENSSHKKFDLYNWNGLIGVYPNAFGVKIGNTEAAGLTSIVSSERDGNRVMAVVLGATDIFDRDLSAATLLDRGFSELAGLEPLKITRADLQTKYDSWVFWE